MTDLVECFAEIKDDSVNLASTTDFWSEFVNKCHQLCLCGLATETMWTGIQNDIIF